MSSISATSNSNYLTPQQQLQAELQQEIDSGTIGSSDQGALSSALNDISSSLQSDTAGGPAAAGNTSPGDIQSKINGLIANEVSSGKLTQQQATELQGVFQNAFAGPDATGGSSVQAVAAVGAAGSPGGAGGPGAGGSGGVHHGHGGHGGHGGASSASSASASSTDTSSASSADQILQQFLQSLQSWTSSTSTYNASGSSTPVTDSSSSAASLLINYRT